MTIRNHEHDTVLENEWYAVRHSGEIPEIALCSAFYYLTEDNSGPCLVLTPHQYRTLVAAAELRYRDIVLRDLLHINRCKPIYRGIKRSIDNWYRYEKFCQRQQVDPISFKHDVAAVLLVFLAEEVVDVERGRRGPSINCTFAELGGFAQRLGLAETMLPETIENLCQAS